jgi:hypothetical protein
MRKNKTIKIYKEEECYAIPEKATEFMAFWQSKLDKIPDEFMDSARVEVEAESYHNGASLDVEISYVRPETDSEMESREYQEKQIADRNKERKLAAYNKLKQELAL